MHLVRCLAFIKAKYEFELMATHVRGVDNPIADALSRDKLPPVPFSPSSGGRGSHTDLTRSPRSTLPLTAGLDIAALDRAVDDCFLNGLAPATRRSYESGKRRFLSFCEKVQAKSLPVSEKLLGQFISQLANE